ncbi:hypothetical protein VTK73DRAFT_2481 [Phialemonium thermophilum]|uniref:Magnesium transporter n=1 Tax=Phialemonium thermophilum TaxID=223376 RepID=A0ABR3Y2L6_9PEZI
MPAASSSPVPSRCLLRYLRAQTQGVALFDASHGAHCVPHTSARRAGCRQVTTTPAIALARGSMCGPSTKPKQNFRAISTSRQTRHEAVLHAGMWDLDALFSRSFGRRPPPSASEDACDPSKQQLHRSSVLYGRSWRERLWYGGTAQTSLGPDDCSLGDSSAGPNSIFSPTRTQAAKAALEPRLRCTEVDENGNVILADGEFKKSELIAKYGLLPRDLRKIDSSNLPHILVRPSAILLNLLHLRVLIKADRVLLFDVYGSRTSYPQSAFMYDLQGKLQQKQSPSAGGLPYEFRALEAVLTSVTTELEAEFETVQAPVIRILSELEDDIDRDKLRILLVLSKKVSTFEQKAKLVRDAIEELLEADDDLSAMYLTEKAHDIYRADDDHTEIEMLLESYHKICDEVAQEAGNLVTSIRNTEEIVRAILDSNRNSLMLLDLKFSIGTLGLAMGTFLAGLYGMNLENFIEEQNWGFGAVTAMSTFFSVLICWYGLLKLRKVQRLNLSSSLRSHDRNHWFRDDGTVGLLDARNREKLRQINMLKAPQPKRRWWS